MDDRIKQMVEGNLGLVGDCIKKIAIFPEEVKDMFSIGTIGLIKAAQSFDESKKSNLQHMRAGVSITKSSWSFEEEKDIVKTFR